MNEMPANPVPPAFEEPKKNNTWIWIVGGVVVFLCCCCIGGLGVWWLWNNGDEIFGTGMNLLAQFA